MEIKRVSYIIQNDFVANKKSAKKETDKNTDLSPLFLLNKCVAYFHPTFGRRNPKSVLYRAQQLQKRFTEKGLFYLLPSQTWSNKKISQIIKNFGKTIDKLAKENNLNKQSLQEAVDNILPEYIKGKIIIKDFSDLIQDLKEDKMFSNESIEYYLNHQALTKSTNKNTNIYLFFDSLYTTKVEIINFKREVKHELTHALQEHTQNISAYDRYKSLSGRYKFRTISKIFNIFESQFTFLSELRQVNLTQKNMLKEYGFDTITELYSNFETQLNEIIRQAKLSGEFSTPSSKSWKQIFTFLKHKAQNEKNAYSSNRDFRECFSTINYPTNAEFAPMFYAEMEKFFAGKELEYTQLCKKEKLPFRTNRIAN